MNEIAERYENIFLQLMEDTETFRDLWTVYNWHKTKNVSDEKEKLGMVDKILEFGKKLLEKFLAWWNKFKPIQKTIMIALVAGVILTIGILTAILTRKQYVELVVCESTKQASAVNELLEGDGLDYNVSSDGLTFSILKSQVSDANLLLGANDIPTSAYSIDDVLNGSFSTTEADKQKKYRVYLESRMEEDLKSYSVVENATVQLTIPEDNGTLISQEKETYASVLLEFNDINAFSEESAANMARFVATALGNDTTDNVTIIDVDGRSWFPIPEDKKFDAALEDTENSMLLKQEAEELIKQEVQNVLNGTNQFSMVEVATNIIMDFSQVEVTEHTYTPADGQEQGVLSHEEIYKATEGGETGGVPGTDSNSETDYMLEQEEGSEYDVYERRSDYLPNETITSTKRPTGVVQYDSSSVSVACVTYNIIKEEDVETQGLLEGTTWEEYKVNNSEKIKQEVDSDLYGIVSNATGIPQSNITIVAYTENHFMDKEEEAKIGTLDIVQIILIIVILLLLGFVVFMSIYKKKEVVEEEEISVEDMLQSTPQTELEEIETEQKTEARKLIEKFVDENPEAVAQLLRNWLNEDWG